MYVYVSVRTEYTYIQYVNMYVIREVSVVVMACGKYRCSVIVSYSGLLPQPRSPSTATVSS